MRRPLFGDGTPQLTDGLAPVEVFDTTAVDPPNEQHTYAVSLFFWANVAEVNGMGVTAWVVTEGGAPVAINVLPVTGGYLAERRMSPQGCYRILDRVLLRGDQQLYFGSPGGGAFNPIAGFVYGYFERDGETLDPVNFRPLQPSPPAAPFNAPYPIVELAAGDPTANVVVHQLSTDYIDVVHMTLSAATEGASGNVAGIVLPDGNLMSYAALDTVLQEDIVFPGIPMRAASSSLTDLQLRLASHVAQASAAGVVGRFARS